MFGALFLWGPKLALGASHVSCLWGIMPSNDVFVSWKCKPIRSSQSMLLLPFPTYRLAGSVEMEHAQLEEMAMSFHMDPSQKWLDMNSRRVHQRVPNIIKLSP